MNYPENYVSSSNLRLEIAIAQQDIDAKSPGICKFKIPALVSNDTVGTVYITGDNIINKTLGNSGNIFTKFDNTIDLYVPKEYTVFYGADIIPAGTRFIVGFVGANINDIRIIGRYDNLET